MVKKTGQHKKTLPFRHHLVLNQWLFSLFGFDSLSGNAPLGDKQAPTLEVFRERFLLRGETTGRNAQGEHLLVQRIREHISSDARLSDEQLLEYDRRIRNVSNTINTGRANHFQEAVEWKYFQYLMLIFTEVYLDYLFNRPMEMAQGLNTQIQHWNEKWLEEEGFNHKPLELIDLEADLWPQLNMIAYWSATGSGKTLIMHANILQYRFYLQRYGKTGDINKVILLTPNEGLTRQHLSELEKSGISAHEFSPQDSGLFAGDVVVIDINKLRENEKEKTVAVDSFGKRNLLLVDEGHRGTAAGAGGVWYRYRKQLCELGFSFEYSATFAQSAINDAVDNEMGTSLRQTYTRAILFDYSYRHFYADGYGKQSQILNIEKADSQSRFLYQVASLLSFYQQLRVYSNERASLACFNLEKPLWVFVTSRVTRGYNSAEANDMVQVLQFLDTVLSKRSETVAAINTLLTKGLIGKGGIDNLYGRFNYLKEQAESGEALYDDLIERVFHSSGGRLYIENIANAPGEIALRGGTSSAPFGVINVGDARKLVQLCEKHKLLVQESRFSVSLFHGINQPDPQINLLLGARKFTEGWSSWRVSTMTLLNVGRNEGAQIIQLFGRGVRLKGWNATLKRSSELAIELNDAGMARPQHIAVLETLNIFGQKSDYIAQFRKELEDEDIPVNEGLQEFVLPLQPMEQLPLNLNVIRIKETVANKALGGAGAAFLELAEQVVLKAPANLTDTERAYFCDPPRVRLDFYPQVGAFSAGSGSIHVVGTRQQKLTQVHLSLLDTRQLYFELLDFKQDKRWSNLIITEDAVADLLNEKGWYQLFAPDEAMQSGRLEQMSLWHDMALSLLRKYCEMFYGLRRKQWEADKLELRPITENKNYLPGVRDDYPDGSYVLTLDRAKNVSLVIRLEQFREKLIQKENEEWDAKVADGLELIWCERHIYQPLITDVHRLDFQVSPMPLNEGEAHFVKNVQKAWRHGLFENYDVYLLRNQTGQGSVGVFIDGGFYPDFILWLVKGDQQKIIFIDPKGLRNHKPDDPKVRFHSTIKEIEATLRQHATGQNIELYSFLVSETHPDILCSRWREHEGVPITQELMESWNILFRSDDERYMEKLLKKVQQP